MAKIAVGDRVAYSTNFLGCIGMQHSDMARAKGIVIGLVDHNANWTLAEIAWDKGQELPGKVNVKNLRKVK